jgi:exosortase J
VVLTAATYNDGTVQKLEASTVCDGGVCRQYSETSRHVTLVYARPHRGVPLQSDVTRPVPVMLKVEMADPMAPVKVAEAQMAATLAEFLKGADMVKVTAPFSKR